RFAELRRRAPHRAFEVRIVAAVTPHLLMMRVEVKREHAPLVAAEPVQEIAMRRPLAVGEHRDRGRDADHGSIVRSPSLPVVFARVTDTLMRRLVLVLALVACHSEPPPAPPAPAPVAAAPAAPLTPEAIARAFVMQVVAHDFAGAATHFD